MLFRSMPAIGAGNSCRVEISRAFRIFGSLFGPPPSPLTWSDLNNSATGSLPVLNADETRDTYHPTASFVFRVPGFPFTAGDTMGVAVGTLIQSITGTIPAGYTVSADAPQSSMTITRTA